MGREPLADAFFGFPDTQEADLSFVTDTLSLLESPVLVVDKDLRIITANLQGSDTLGWIRLVNPGESPEDVLPSPLAEVVAPRIRKRVHEIVKDVAVIKDPPFLFDVFMSKGRIRGETYTFVVLMQASTGQKLRGVTALQRLLGGVGRGAFVADREVKFADINDEFLELAGYSREELVGHHMNEFNTSEQALVYGRIFQSLIDEPRVLRSPAVTYSAARRGAFVTPLTCWTITDRKGDALGLAGVGGFRSRPRPLVAEVERRHVLLEKAADLMGEAIFITDRDGRILVMNPAAEKLIPDVAVRDKLNVKTDIPWEIPGTIEDIFAELSKGREEFILNTAILMRDKKTILKTRIFGLKRVSREVQEIVFVCEDITQQESLKQNLFQTTRRLADDRALRDGILDNVDIPFTVVDENFVVLDANEATAERFRKSKQEVLGMKLTDLNPNLPETGLLDYIRSTIKKGEVLRKPDHTHVTAAGERTSLGITLIPVDVGRRTVCVVIAERESSPELEGPVEEINLKAKVADLLLENITEGVFILDRDGNFLEVSEGVLKGSSLPREHFVGRNVKDLIAMSEEEELFAALWERVRDSDEPFRSGVIKSRSRVDGMEQFVDLVVNPIAGPTGSIDKYVVIVHYLSEIKSLEKQVADYTANLENMVTEQTRELTDSNALLASTAERVARAARSGGVMASLRDRKSVLDTFLKLARDVIGADYLKIVLKDDAVKPPGIEQRTLGREPGEEPSTSEAIEEAMSGMMNGVSVSGRAQKPLDNLILAVFASGSERGLFICRKSAGRFSPIDVDLAHLLCTQLSFALPAASYVAEQRREREKAECLRRIAFRVAGLASVKEAVRAVAEETSRIIGAERFFWLVKEVGDLVWVTEIYKKDGSAPVKSAHVELKGGKGASHLFDRDGAREISCERLRKGGGAMSTECRFVAGEERGGSVGVARKVLLEQELIDDEGGACAMVPVHMTQDSPGYICAYSSRQDVFTDDDICFICLAASAVGRVWLEADAASSIRRLEKTGETMGELAHDFRYPMSKITELLRRLAAGEMDAADSRQSAAPLLADVEHLASLSREFLDLSNPGSEKPEFLDLVRVLEGSLAIAADDLESKSITVEKEFDDRPMPPVLANRNDVSRVFINLIANSHDAVDEGGWIKLRAFMDDSGGGRSRVTVTVQNSGPPVSPAIRDELFSPFKSTKEGGTGLGLFSARRRANANGGDVTFEVDEDGRERFTVWFPAAFE